MPGAPGRSGDPLYGIRRVLLRGAENHTPPAGGGVDTLLAYSTTGRASNGPTGAMNLLITRIKRVEFEFRNFANYRLRLLLHCGVTSNTHRTTRIRGWSPRMVSWSRRHLLYGGSTP